MPSCEIVIYFEITGFFKKIEPNKSDFPIFVLLLALFLFYIQAS
jgi:hypothetical protein